MSIAPAYLKRFVEIPFLLSFSTSFTRLWIRMKIYRIMDACRMFRRVTVGLGTQGFLVISHDTCTTGTAAEKGRLKGAAGAAFVEGSTKPPQQNEENRVLSWCEDDATGWKLTLGFCPMEPLRKHRFAVDVYTVARYRSTVVLYHTLSEVRKC